MEIYYGSKGIDNYLEVCLGEGLMLKSSPDNYRIRMLQNNDIEGIIKPNILEMDGKMILKYNTCSYYVLDRLFLRIKPDGGFLGVIMEQLEKALARVKAYLLNPDDVVLKPEYMFYNWGEKSLRLIYIPGYGDSIKRQLKAFLEYIMKIFDHRDEDGVRYMYNLYELVAEDTFSIADFKYGAKRLELSKGSVNSDSTDGAFRHEEGGSISPADNCSQHYEIKKLVPLTNGALKEIIITKYDEMIIVGRGKRETDYRIPTTQISRVHACIYLRSNGVFVEDRESTNGTFINSVRLEPLNQEQIKVGDLVNFANEEFFVV